LIVRKGVNHLLRSTSDLNHPTIPTTTTHVVVEHSALQPDTAYRTASGKVLNRQARFSLCFATTSQPPNYSDGKGTIVSYRDVPITNWIKHKLMELYFGGGNHDKEMELPAEASYYYNLNKCGIGFHGLAERKIVIAFHLGASIPMHFQWYLKDTPVGERIKLTLYDGDIYVLSEAAIGANWKKDKNNDSIYTIQHAAGANKYLDLPYQYW
jgi:hypothetical protein